MVTTKKQVEPKVPTRAELQQRLHVLYEELIGLNKLRDKGKPKENEKTQKRITELNIAVRDIEHVMATQKLA